MDDVVPPHNELRLGTGVRSSLAYGADYLTELDRVVMRYVRPVTRAFLEWGTGHTTLALASHRARYGLDRLVTIDDNAAYQAAVVAQLPTWPGLTALIGDRVGPRNSDRDPEPNYATLPLTLGRRFDFVFIDGRRRLECALVATQLCHAGSVVALHDYRRGRYQPILALYDLLEDGNQFRVLRPKPAMLLAQWPSRSQSA